MVTEKILPTPVVSPNDALLLLYFTPCTLNVCVTVCHCFFRQMFNCPWWSISTPLQPPHHARTYGGDWYTLCRRSEVRGAAAHGTRPRPRQLRRTFSEFASEREFRLLIRSRHGPLQNQTMRKPARITIL